MTLPKNSPQNPVQTSAQTSAQTSTRTFQAPRGTHDILPSQIASWRFVEEQFRAVCALHNYGEIRTPLFEPTELFARATGASCDVMVTKQMYSFVAPDEQSYTLRPEGTAGVVRAYIEHHLEQLGPVAKLFYISSCFRYEAPQAGRLRQFNQCGVEVLGAQSPSSDVEVLSLAHSFLRVLEVPAKLLINSLGTSESRRGYVQLLREYFEPFQAQLSEDSQKRLDTNPLRIFDSKDDSDRELLINAPRLLDYLREHDTDSSSHFAEVCAQLQALNIEYSIDHNLVRGFDYYSGTAFEFVSDQLGAQSTVLGGGRYDGLVEELGGAKTSGIGWGCGVERLLLVREALGLKMPAAPQLSAFLVMLGDNARAAGPRVLHTLRAANVSCDCDYVGRSMRAQMREANRQNAKFALLLGDDELAANSIAVKNMESGEQEVLALEDAIARLQ